MEIEDGNEFIKKRYPDSKMFRNLKKKLSLHVLFLTLMFI